MTNTEVEIVELARRVLGFGRGGRVRKGAAVCLVGLGVLASSCNQELPPKTAPPAAAVEHLDTTKTPVSLQQPATVLPHVVEGPAPEGKPGPAPSVRAMKILAALRASVPPNDSGAGSSHSVDQPASEWLPPGPAATFRYVDTGLRPQFASTEHAAARVFLPTSAHGAFHLEDAATSLGIDVTLDGSRDVNPLLADGYAVYPRAHRTGASLLQRALPSGLEDYISFESKPSLASVSYGVRPGNGFKGLRLVENVLEFLDAGGAPRLRVEPPYIVGSDGARTYATLAVEGCAVDKSPAAPWGRPVTAPGSERCTVRVSWDDAAVSYPAVLDPRWTATTNTMFAKRQGHTATLLSTGKVLVAGGSDGTNPLSSAELFDPTTGSWATTQSFTGPRQLHTAVQLGTNANPTTSGKVLIAGGWNGATTTSGAAVATAQLYSVTAGTWMAAASLPAIRAEHTTTVLANGQVLVVGGVSDATGTGVVLQTAATYDPTTGTGGIGTWTATTNMAGKARFHTATLITATGPFNNKVLVVGSNTGGTTSTAVVQVYTFGANPAWTSGGVTQLPAARDSHTATVLTNGQVLVTGGKSGTAPWNTTLVFNPATAPGTWTSAGTMNATHTSHTATLLSTSVLANGLVLVAGGAPTSTNSAEVWNGTTTWTPTTALTTVIQGHTATLLSTGNVLIAGGVTGTTPLQTAQVYDPSWALTCTGNSQCATGFCVSGVCCDTACNTGCGACNLTGKVGTCSPVAVNTACPDDGNACTTDKCDGTTLTCQHAKGNAGAPCRSSTGPCDLAATCTGTSTVCPANAFQPSTHSCRDATGPCDVAETCTGTSAACPADGFQPSTHSCRDATGPCDVAATCMGTSAVCPANGFQPSTHSCRDATGPCDIAATCTGTSAACPPNGFQPPTHSCRDATGPCDVAETCTGTSATCPVDGFVVCAAQDQCHLKGTCNPTSGHCGNPAKLNGTTCDDGNTSTTGDVCQLGVCRAPSTYQSLNAYPAEDLGNLGGTLSEGNGINDDGEIVGNGTTAAGSNHAFTWTDPGPMQDVGAGSGFPAVSTASDVNDSFIVTGTLTESSGSHHAFLYDGFTVTDLGPGGDDHPDAFGDRGSYASTLNNSGKVTGYYSDGGDVHGFRYNGSVIEDIGSLAGRQTIANDISDAGVVVGSSWVSGTPANAGLRSLGHAFMRDDALNRLVDLNEFVDPVSGWTLIQAKGISPGGQYIVGTGDRAGLLRGFRLNTVTGVVDEISTGWLGDTFPYTVNDSGDVAGTGYPDAADSSPTGFLYTDQVGFRNLNDVIDPANGWTIEVIAAMNAEGDLTGYGRFQGQNRALRLKRGVSCPSTCPAVDQCHKGVCDPRSGTCTNIPKVNGTTCDDGQSSDNATCQLGACRAPRSYPAVSNLQVEDIGELGGGSSNANAINSFDEVVGESGIASGAYHAFVWDGGGSLVDIGVAPGFLTNSSATAINDNGTIAGGMSSGPSNHAFRYGVDGVEDLGVVGDNSIAPDVFSYQGASVDGMNASGQLTGWFTSNNQIHAYRYDGATFRDVGALANGLTFGFGISDAGMVVGSSWVPGTVHDNGPRRLGHAFFWTDDTNIDDLNRYIDSPLTGWTLHDAASISPNGRYISGDGEIGGILRVYRFDTSTGHVDEASRGGPGDAFAGGVNDNGDVVGMVLDATNTIQKAFIYTDQIGFKLLNDIVDSASGWDLQDANTINAHGDIVGWGRYQNQYRAFRLRNIITPQVACAGKSEGASCDAVTVCGTHNVCHLGVCGGGDITGSSDTCLISLLTPTTCTYDVGDGSSRAVFGYTSQASTNIHIAPGPQNQTTIVGQSAGTGPTPPAWFFPGDQRGAFVVPYPTGGTATWTLGENTATTAGAAACMVTQEPAGPTAQFPDSPPIVIVPYASFPFANAVVPTDTSYSPADQILNEVLAIAGLPPIAPRAAGAIPATFQVTDDGAAQYEIPIVTPPGRNGVEPHLRLVYNSRAGDGAMGPGWTIAGLSKITRCNRTRADAILQTAKTGQTTDSRAVQFDGEDELCLDGDRLVRVGDGPNMLGEYRTQRDVFAKIIVATSDSSGPREFTVFRADGMIDTYGSEDNANATARVDTSQTTFDAAHPQGTSRPVRAAWYLSKVSDRFQNTMSISYVRDFPVSLGFFGSFNAEMESMPDEIHYTSNSATGMQPDRSLKFHYVPTTLNTLSSVANAGWVRARAELVQSIDINGPNPIIEGLVRSYKFSYTVPFNEATGELLPQGNVLGSVQVCDGAGACQMPTTLQYENVSESFQRVDTGISDAYLAQNQLGSYADQKNNTRSIVTGDVNGDGRDDLIYRKNAEFAFSVTPFGLHYVDDSTDSDPYYQVRLSTGTGFTDPFLSGFPLLNDTEIDTNFIPTAALVDLDGDGRLDAVVPHQGAGSAGDPVDLDLFLSTSVPFPNLPVPITDPPAPQSMIFSPYSEPTTDPEFVNPSPMKQCLVGDINGDGLPEFVRAVDTHTDDAPWRVGFRTNSAQGFGSSYQLVTIQNQGAGQLHPIWGGPAPGVTFAPILVDVDGDGRAELVYIDADSRINYDSHYSIAHIDSSATTRTYSALPTSVVYPPLFIDYNGDGLKDAITATGTWQNIGTGYLQGPPVDSRLGSGIVVDFDGDGREDVLYLSCTAKEPAYQHPTLFRSLGNGAFVEQVLSDVPTSTSAPFTTVSNVVPRCLEAVLDVNGDGLPDIVQAEEDKTSLQLYVNQSRPANVLKTITNGIGSTVSIEYGTVAATIDACTFPEACGSKVHVVSAYNRDNGTGGATQSSNRFTLTYEHPVTDLLGRGWQGFKVKTETNQQTGQTKRLTFNLTRVNGFYPFAGMVESETDDTPLTSTGGAVRKIKQVQDFQTIAGDPAVGTPFAVRPHTIAEFEFSADSMPTSWDGIAPIVSRVTTNRYDAFGNLTSTDVTSTNAFRQNVAEDVTEYTFAQDTGAWLISQPRSMTKRSTGPNGEAGVERYQTFETYPSSGLVHFTHVEPTAGNADEHLDVETVIDELGNVRGSIAKDENGNARSTTVDYDDRDATFPATIKDALGLPTKFVYHQGLGVLVQKTKPNQATASWEYDGFGRIRKEQTSDGPAMLMDYERTPNDIGYIISWAKAGGGSGATSYDSLGRPSTAESVGFDGAIRNTLIAYERNFGTVASQSQPSAGGVGGSTTTDYDEVGRPIKVSTPGQEPIFIRYSSLARTTYQGATLDSSVTRSIDLRDEWGRTTSSQNVLDQVHLSPGRPDMSAIHSTTTDFEYGPFGLVRHVFNRGDSQVVTTEDQYDRLGRRILLIDPDAGPRQTRYNAFGDVRGETDAMGVDTIYDPDPLGRPRIITKGSATDTFAWDSSSGVNGLGQLGSTLSASGIGSQNLYDGVGRLRDQTTIDGGSYTFHFDYDPTTCKLSQVEYPATTAGARISLSYSYSPNDGTLEQLDMTHSAVPVWKKTAVADGGQTSAEALGNGEVAFHDYDTSSGRLMHISAGTGTPQINQAGYTQPANAIQNLTYTYDEFGRVKSKTDDVRNTGEVYQTYDNLDRLVTWTSADGTNSVTYDYSDLGNLKVRHQTTNGVQEPDEVYAYGVGAGPHAVTGGPLGSYGYDENGRQTSRPGQPLVSYNRFDLPDSIAHDETTTYFKYDVGGVRAEKTADLSSTIYVGGLYERRQSIDETAHVFYVPGPSGIIAQLVCTGPDGSATCGAFEYLYGDRLGSVDTISRESGPAHVSRDPYGRSMLLASDVHVGFTNEEQDDDLGLVNLNHRLYDPMLGRFISPDPLIVSVFSGQAHNRYAYAMNSPTLATDRTGLDGEFDVTSCDGCGTPVGPITETGTNVWVMEPELVGGVNAGGVPDPTSVPLSNDNGPPDLLPSGAGSDTTIAQQRNQGGNYSFPGDASNTYAEVIGLPISTYDRFGHDGETLRMLQDNYPVLIGAAGFGAFGALGATWLLDASVVASTGVAAGTGALAIPTLTTGSQGQMFGQAIGYLRTAASNMRVDMFRSFALQIEGASKGAWSAVEMAATNGTVFLGQAGSALVFNASGQMFRGEWSGGAFAFTPSGGLNIAYDLLREIH